MYVQQLKWKLCRRKYKMLMNKISIIARSCHIFSDRRLSTYNINSTEQTVLMLLNKKSKMNQDEIAKYFFVDKGTIAKTLRKLEEKHLIIRNINKDNQREKIVTLSEKGKESLKAKFYATLASRGRIAQMSDDVINRTKSLKSRLMAVSMLRNNPYHNRVEEYLKVLSDNAEDLELRVKLTEALGWFTLSCKRDSIVNRCSELANSQSVAPELKSELLKTVERIKVYMR